MADFRSKEELGWHAHVEKYTVSPSEYFYATNWTEVYYRHVLMRDACFNCKYTTTNRKTDFTIGDYWGIGKNAPRFDDNKGVSLVLVHSGKGREILEEIKEYLDMEQTNIETSMQPQLSRPVRKGYEYNAFWKKYRKNPAKAVKKYFFPSALRRACLKLEKFIKRTLKKLLKKIKH